MIAIFKVIFLFFWYISFVLLFLKSKKFKKIYTITFAISLISMIALLSCYYLNSLVYLQAREATLKSGPADLYHDVDHIKDGDKVMLLQRRDGWLLVKAGNENRGWLREQDVYEKRA